MDLGKYLFFVSRLSDLNRIFQDYKWLAVRRRSQTLGRKLEASYFFFLLVDIYIVLFICVKEIRFRFVRRVSMSLP